MVSIWWGGRLSSKSCVEGLSCTVVNICCDGSDCHGNYWLPPLLLHYFVYILCILKKTLDKIETQMKIGPFPALKKISNLEI